jgi:hypothetical protein
MRMMSRLYLVGALAAAVLLASAPAESVSELLTRVEFDSNVNRGITERKSDGAVSVLLSTERQPSGESRVEWVYDAAVQAAGYFTYTDLNYLELSSSVGLLYRPHALVTVTVRPFASVRGVSDSAQSAVTIGAQASVSEQVSAALTLTQYYVYRQAFAREDTYSYGMQSGGLVIAVSPVRNVLAEASYEISYGDSFVSPGPGGPPEHSGRPDKDSGGGNAGGPEQGQKVRFSRAFDQFVIKEKITLHTLGFRAQINLAPAWFCAFRYSYGAWTGESGNSSVHLGSLAIIWRF